MDRLALPEPWRGDIEAAVRLIDTIDFQIGGLETELREDGADHRYVPLLMTLPGISWVLAYTIAAEIGDTARFATPTKLVGYSGLCPQVYQSGESDHRGSLRENGPKYLCWALIEGHPRGTTSPLRRPLPGHGQAARPQQGARRSPASTSRDGWPRRSGTCS